MNLRRYGATELLEQEYKGRAAALNTIIEQMMLSDPEFRELMTEILGRMAGTRTPASSRSWVRAWPICPGASRSSRIQRLTRARLTARAF